MDWRYSDHSDDDANNEVPATSRKRSSRGPSYKRGPPKGYIHAIEQRWHQVESLLGAVLQCPDSRVQDLVSDLKQDDLAREIIRRVDNGPYGPSGRRSQPDGATKEDFFASILKSNEGSGPSRDSARARRQSRVSREIVSSNIDNGLSVIPTKEWQDSLSQLLASSSSNHEASRRPRRRRLDSVSPNSHSDWPDTDTMEGSSLSFHLSRNFSENCAGEEEEDLKAATEAIGELSLDENQEVRFHGRSSGLHLITKNNRTDDRVEGGLWRLPMSRIWPASKCHKNHPQHISTPPLPEIHIQDRLIDLYFNYVHPIFPILHKSRFLESYRSSGFKTDAVPSHRSPESPRPESSQEVTPLLLFSIFSIAARFCQDQMPLHSDSEPSTVQSLLLLGCREIGIGSQEQAWLFIGASLAIVIQSCTNFAQGMAIRMATDLGLNCDSSKWKSDGHSLFSPGEIETREQIWWACCIADTYGSVYLGRPVIIKEDDFDVPLPSETEASNHPKSCLHLTPFESRIFQTSEVDMWPPLSNPDSTYRPVPGHTRACWRAAASLTMITGSIVEKMYAIRHLSPATTRMSYGEIESRLDRWYIGLSEVLRSEPTSRNTAEFKAFDLAQGAATHLSAIATVYRETYSLKRAPPFLTSTDDWSVIASVMHILTLTLRPQNVQASLGFQQCMAALKDLEVVWPSASRAWELLNGVKMGSDDLPPQINSLNRPKRQADAAFGQEKSSNYLQREAFKTPVYESNVREENTGVQELGTRIMAHMLGLNIPGVEASTSYYPGYEWWPRSQESPQPVLHHVSSSSGDYGSRTNMSPTNHSLGGRASEWSPVPITDPLYPSYEYNRYGGL
ncbi:hypothetical protein H0H93_011416 [Arthromyces matolae]|nr:hypothetical protein H0H93_011416 [Arthromyces matolae]